MERMRMAAVISGTAVYHPTKILIKPETISWHVLSKIECGKKHVDIIYCLKRLSRV